MRYVVRSLKYFLLICVLYLGIVWYESLNVAVEGVSFLDVLKAQLYSQHGAMLISAFVILAMIYPLFGYMKRTVDNCDMVEDAVRIHNAMQCFGFEVVGQRGEYTVFRAKGFIRRLSFLFEDEVLVRQVGSGIEIAGIRRAVARIIYQLHAYISQKRFE